VVGQTEVVVQAPAKYLFASEAHVGTEFAFQLGEDEVAFAGFAVLADRAAGGLFDSFKDIFHFLMIL
jgi:hypothetical protein